MRYALPLLFSACLLLSGCYQAQVTTGKAPGNTVVEESFAPSFIYGIVPATVDVSDECQNGIASAEREISFINGLVGGITLNLFLPQSVTVTCAAEGGMSDISPGSDGLDLTIQDDASTAEIKETLSTAATHSVVTQEPVEVEVQGLE